MPLVIVWCVTIHQVPSPLECVKNLCHGGYRGIICGPCKTQLLNKIHVYQITKENYVKLIYT